MHFEAGQVWRYGKWIWAGGQRIVDVDRRLSVTLLKTQSIYGTRGEWISAGIFEQWIENTGASLQNSPAVETSD